MENSKYIIWILLLFFISCKNDKVQSCKVGERNSSQNIKMIKIGYSDWLHNSYLLIGKQDVDSINIPIMLRGNDTYAPPIYISSKSFEYLTENILLADKYQVTKKNFDEEDPYIVFGIYYNDSTSKKAVFQNPQSGDYMKNLIGCLQQKNDSSLNSIIIILKEFDSLNTRPSGVPE